MLQGDNRRHTIPSVQAEAAAYVTHSWSRRVAQPVLIAIFVSSLLISVLSLMVQLMPGTPWMILAPIIFIVSLIGVYSSIWLSLPTQRPLNKVAYRGAEIVVILLLLRVFTWLVSNTWPEFGRIQEYLRYPLTFFGGNLFVFGSVFTFSGWMFAGYLGSLFGDLSIDMAEATYYLLPSKDRNPDNKPVAIYRDEVTQQFFRLWVLGGIGMALMATISTFDLSTFSSSSPFAMARLGLGPAILMALIGYFLAGLLLVSQGRLATMKARWLMGGVLPSQTIERNWHRNSAWLLGLLALVAAFLPLGSTFAISRILQAILFGITAIIGLVTTLLLSLLAIFFQQITPEELITPETTAVATPAATPPPQAPPPPPDDTLAIIGSSAFWTLVIVVSVLAVSLILRERGVRLNTTMLRLVWLRFKTQLRRMWRGTRRQVKAMQQAINRRRQAAIVEKDGEKRPFRFLRVNALPPREQIRYFYLSTVRRAGEQGVARRENETPLEYARDLKAEWPDAEADLDGLTDAFVRARYTPQPIAPEEISPIKAQWRKVRSKLRQKDGTTDPPAS